LTFSRHIIQYELFWQTGALDPQNGVYPYLLLPWGALFKCVSTELVLLSLGIDGWQLEKLQANWEGAGGLSEILKYLHVFLFNCQVISFFP